MLVLVLVLDRAEAFELNIDVVRWSTQESTELLWHEKSVSTFAFSSCNLGTGQKNVVVLQRCAELVEDLPR